MQPDPMSGRRRLPRHLRPPSPGPDVFSFTVRPAVPADLIDVREIYNHYVTNSAVTFENRRTTLAHWRDRLTRLQKLGLPFLVAQSPSGQLLGFAFVQPWAGGSSHRYTVEDLIYLGPAAGGKGLGSALLGELIAASAAIGLREVIAIISDRGAEASIRLHRRHGYVEAGRLGGVGHRFGRSQAAICMRLTLPGRDRRWFGRPRRMPAGSTV